MQSSGGKEARQGSANYVACSNWGRKAMTIMHAIEDSPLIGDAADYQAGSLCISQQGSVK